MPEFLLAVLIPLGDLLLGYEDKFSFISHCNLLHHLYLFLNKDHKIIL